LPQVNLSKNKTDAMPNTMTIMKKDGTLTNPPMAQPQAVNYLKNLINANRLASLKQALNDAFDGKGKATGDYLFNGHAVLHASSGDGQQSVSLFFYVTGGNITLFAMGEHLDLPKPKVRYKLVDYGQPVGTFQQGATIILV
jgi:hypothetical protein